MTSIESLYKIFLQCSVVCTDTRKLPSGCLFFALKGANFNGNRFALQSLEEGAAYAVIDEDINSDNPRLLRVPDVLKALQQLATYHRKQLHLPVLAITGSNGKTTTKELTAAVLRKKFNVLYTQGNLNNHIGVPLTLLALRRDHEFAVIEMGANHQGEIAELAAIAQPDFGLITNIGKAHLEGFGGPEGVKKGKGELYAFLREKQRLIFVRAGDQILEEVLGSYSPTVSYGDTPSADIRGTASMNGELLVVEVTSPFHLRMQTQLTGIYNFDNVLSAVAVGSHFGVPPAMIKEAVEGYQPDNQRSQLIRNDGLQIILDAYNANPTSMTAALENFRTSFPGKKYLALGEMRELGNSADEEHTIIANLAAGIDAEWIMTVGDHFKTSAAALGFLHFDTSTQAADWLKEHLPNEGALIIKGSRGSKMEILLNAFEG